MVDTEQDVKVAMEDVDDDDEEEEEEVVGEDGDKKSKEGEEGTDAAVWTEPAPLALLPLVTNEDGNVAGTVRRRRRRGEDRLGIADRLSLKTAAKGRVRPWRRAECVLKTVDGGAVELHCWSVDGAAVIRELGPSVSEQVLRRKKRRRSRAAASKHTEPAAAADADAGGGGGDDGGGGAVASGESQPKERRKNKDGEREETNKIN